MTPPRKKTGLGRGRGALIQEKERPAEVRTLPIDRLKPNRFQPRTRFDEELLAELAESIRAQGVIQPLVVAPGTDGDYTIVAGERRWRAARRAGLSEVPVVLREVSGDRELLELALVENLQRSDLNPIEEAEAFHALQEGFSLTQEELALRVGKSRASVGNSLRLLKLPDEVKDFLRRGELTAGQARPLLGLGSQEAQVALAIRAIAEKLSARELERLVAQPASATSASAPGKSPKPKLDVHTAAAVETLTKKLQTRVEIRRRGKAGVLQVHFHSEDELIRLYDLLLGREGES